MATRLGFRLVIGVAVAVLGANGARAQTVEVPNADFAQGEAGPAGWTLSGGAGAWEDGCLTATGQGDDSSYWRSGPLALEPMQTYQLQFRARRVVGSEGAPTSGPIFCNRDLRGLNEEWSERTSYFSTLSEMSPEHSWLRFGQWHVKGTVAYDDICLARADAVYRQVNGIPLGDGERVSGNLYEFRAPLAGTSSNHARPLHAITCAYNHPRLVFGNGDYLVYRHQIGAFNQVAARIEVQVGYYVGGELLTEASGDGASWVELGVLDAVGSGSYDVPVSLLPAESVYVRFSARPRTSPDTKSSIASLQIHGYTYNATLDGDAGEALGATRFVASPVVDERVAVRVETLGEARPGGENMLGLKVTNHTNAPITAAPSLRLVGKDGEDTTTAPETKLMPGENTVTFPYDIAQSGELRAELSLGDGIGYRGETGFYVSPLFTASYGEGLPGSTDNVGLWWASSGWKVSRSRPLPKAQGEAVRIQTARNEAEAAQFVVRPETALAGLVIETGRLKGPNGASISAEHVEVLEVGYVNVVRPSDVLGAVAPWPDPLPPLNAPLDIEAGENQSFWVRVTPPKDAAPGEYRGEIRLAATGYAAAVPIAVEVYDFTLPDRMTCVTAFGMGPGRLMRYHNVKEEADKRTVYDQYLEALGKHHIACYDPAALDRFGVSWPHRDTLGETPTAAEIRTAFTPEFDWQAWDAAMTRAIDDYHFTSFRLPIQGMGGGTFHSRSEPQLLGYAEDTPEYKAAFTAYCQGVQEHLREKGWLDEAFVYWFDEPSPKDYAFVNNGFRKLKEAAPDIVRMLTEQVEPELIGGPNIWCPLTPSFDPALAEERRAQGERFWWYVCTGPKAPYAGLFIDHPGTDLRVWLWQTWKRRISGILVWESVYWTSSAAYPDAHAPQNPYEDPMGWTSGYSTPAGTKRPWGNGDGRFLYPPKSAADGNPPGPVLEAPVDTMRIEMLRDGIEDYEYMVMLSRLLEEKGAALDAAQRDAFEALLEVPDAISKDLTNFTWDPAPIEAHRTRVARAIETLNRLP